MLENGLLTGPIILGARTFFPKLTAQTFQRIFNAMIELSRITIDPKKRSGKPCIRDTRITVFDVLEYLASGMSEDAIIADFPELKKEDIRACLVFAANRERQLVGAA